MAGTPAPPETGGAGIINLNAGREVVCSGTPKASAKREACHLPNSHPSRSGRPIVKHGGGWTSIYGHAAKLLVQRGQAVKRGQTIALSGASGYADRPELHFELRQGRTPVDPLRELPRR